MSSCNIDSTQSLQYFLSEPWKKRKFIDSCLKETEVHRAQKWKDNAASRGKEKQGCEGEEGEHRGDAERKGGGGAGVQRLAGLTHREVLASQAT